MAIDPLPREQIIDSLNHKSKIKSLVFLQTMEVFAALKDILGEISNDINEVLETTSQDRKVRLEYRDKGKYEAELKFADDVLVFSMHTDVFQFDRDHSIWRNEYVKSDPLNSYCGMINVYNFLSDSLKYNRAEDLGYLVARLFVNREKKFFVEGKRQRRRFVRNFGKVDLNREELQNIVESAILYSLSFDLLVPPFDLVKVASVEQINAKIESSKMQTAKRLGFQYNSDDVLDGED